MSPSGRNDPCPCGSGRKYKRCCAQAEPSVRRAYTADDRNTAFARLVRLVRRPEFAHERALAEAEFWSNRLELLPPEVADQIAGDDALLVAYLTWLVFDFELADGPDPTIAGRLLRTRGADLSGGERVWIERMAASWLRLVEIVDVCPDEGLDLTDMTTGEQLVVTERAATSHLRRWDVIAVRIIEGPAGTLELEGHPYRFPRRAATELRDEIIRRRKALLRAPGAGPEAEAHFTKGLGSLVHHFWLDLVVSPPRPTIVTAEGDEMVFTTAVFEVLDEAQVRRGLAGHPELVAEDDHFTWIEPAAGMERVLGAVRLAKGRLTLETQSTERAARGRALLEAALGEALRYRISTNQTADQAMAEAPRRPRERVIPSEVEQQVVTEYLERYYRAWIDEPVPALGGRTPRHAARLKTGRQLVIDLLKEIENGMAHERAEGRPAIELGWLWTELGVATVDGGASRGSG